MGWMVKRWSKWVGGGNGDVEVGVMSVVVVKVWR